MNTDEDEWMNKPPALELRSGAVLLYDLPEFIIYAGRGGYGVRFTVLLGVRNDSHHKHVGVVWRPVVVDGTGDQPDWQRTTMAYIGPLFDDIELWGGACSAIGPVVDYVELAAFAEMNGTQHWDNANGHNYRLKDSTPSPAHAVAAFGIVTQPASGSARSFEGSASVWPYEGERHVDIVYSTDDWRSVSVVQATPSGGNDFSWRTGIPAEAHDVDFVARLVVGSVAFSTAAKARSYAKDVGSPQA
jgi:hypothetical protein